MSRQGYTLLVAILVILPVAASIRSVAAESATAQANTQKSKADDKSTLTSKDFIPLISTLIGGFLAVMGGFVSNYLLQLKSRQAEKRKVVREKLEELYVLAIQVDDWLNHWYRQCISGVALPLQNITDNPAAKLLMLVRLYEPSLSQDAEQLAKQLEHFRLRVQEYLMRFAIDKMGGRKLKKESFNDFIQQSFDLASKSQKVLLESIERVFQI